MSTPRDGVPASDRRTYGGSRAVRHPETDYAGDIDVHLTICAARGRPFADAETARMVCENIEFYCENTAFRLYGYCLMPDHLHVLLSPAESQTAVAEWLRKFKSFTTRQHQRRKGESELWQRSAHDHVCRTGESAVATLRYIVNNPVRSGLADDWRAWPWTKVFVEV